MKGVCTCGNNLWEWTLDEDKGELTLVCTGCGREAHFTVPFPFIDIFSDALPKK